MNMSIALQRPPYKGKLNFDEETYLGVIAFGNALGNSIVRGVQTNYNDRLAQQNKISNGLNQAKINRAVDLNIQSPDLSQVANNFNYSVGLQLDAKNNASLNRSDARSQYRADYGNYLSASSDWNIQNLEYQTYNYRTSQGIERAQLSAAQQRRFEFGNAQASVSFDALRPTGFNGNFTEAEWLATINNKTQQWAAPVYKAFGYAADAALLLTGIGAIGVGAKLALYGAKNIVRGAIISGSSYGTSAAGLSYAYGGYSIGETGVNIINDTLSGFRSGNHASSAYINSGIDSATQIVDIRNAASHILDKGGLARGSFAVSLFDKDYEIKGVAGLYNDDLRAVQGKFPNLGANFTGTVASDLNINMNGFKKDNLNITERYNFGSNSFSTIYEADILKGDILNLGRFGKFKGSIGTRTSNGITVPAVNFGYEWNGFTFSAEFRGK